MTERETTDTADKANVLIQKIAHLIDEALQDETDEHVRDNLAANVAMRIVVMAWMTDMEGYESLAELLEDFFHFQAETSAALVETLLELSKNRATEH